MQKKFNLLIPIAGKGSRFLEQGYKMPKSLIMVGDKHIIDWSFECFDTSECNLIFIVRQDHIDSFSIDTILKEKFGTDISIIKTDTLTEGTVCSCLLAKDLINNSTPLIVYTLDINFSPKFIPGDLSFNQDGVVATFKANNPAYSYVKQENGLIIETAEKKVISKNAAVGVYYFKEGKDFVHYGEKMIELNLRVNNEFYVCPLYNLMIKDGLKISALELEKVHVIGTPEEVAFFKTYAFNKFGSKPIALVSDHSGYEAKKLMKKVLKDNKLEFIDFGTYTNTDCDYSDYIPQATQSIKDGLCGYGIGFCRSGQGVNINANKILDIRAGLVYDEESAKFSISHNCVNFFSIPSKFASEELFTKYINIWKTTSFDGGRHSVRLNKINKK